MVTHTKRHRAGKPIQAIIQNAFAVDDPEGEAVLDSKGNRLWDSELKQVENIPLDKDIKAYIAEDVLPFVPDAVVDETVTDQRDGQIGVVGYEVNFNKYFYSYVPPRDPEEIAKEILDLEEKIGLLFKELFQ